MRSITLIFCLSLSISLLKAQTFSGPIDVCFDNCEEYNFFFANGNTPYWQVTGGEITENSGEQIDICWTGSTGLIEIFDPSVNPNTPSFTQIINIFDKPSPDISFPNFPICVETDTLGETGQDIPPVYCQSVCGASSVKYLPQGDNLSTYSWEVIGENSSDIQNDGILIEWPDQGYGSLFLIEENQLGCKDSIRYCIEILEKPEVSIGTKTGVNLTDICIGQTIYFEANTGNAIHFEWLTSDGQTSQSPNPSFSFEEQGNYNISLISATECLCFDTTSVNIVVNEYFTPSIECAGTICSSDNATYYAGENCAEYNWTISPNGVITEGGTLNDNYVNVQWNNGQEGIVTLSTVNCDDPDICSNPTSVFIPIISDDLSIEGSDVVCRTGANTYSVPLFEGASYQWNITGNGVIYDGQGTNNISIVWEETPWEPDTALIEVLVDHCYLECSSSATKSIILLDRFELNTPPIHCEDANTYIYAFAGWNSASVDWYVSPPNGDPEYLEASGTTSLSKTFTEGPGLYKVRAEENSGIFCNNEATIFFNVIKRPEINGSINGDRFICHGNFYEYSMEPLPSNLNYQWSITDGFLTENYSGESIFHQWNTTGPYKISVIIEEIETNCESDPVELIISPLDVGEIIGDSESCIDNIGHYEMLDADAKETDWTIVPSTAGTIEVLDNGGIDVHWHESGNFKIIANYCSANLELDVTVIPNPLNNINYPDGICPGELANISIPTAATSTVEVYDESGSLVANSTNFDITAGYYSIELSDINQCLFKQAIYIDEYPVPEVNISSDELEQLCDPDGLVVIEAYVTNEVSSYEWFLDGNPIGFNNPRLLGAGPGTYQVKVTNHYGCEAFSPPLVAECVVSMCECRPDGGTAFSYVQNEYCNEFSFTNQSFSYVAGSLVYNFNDPESGSANITTDENPDHTFSHPGHFAVNLRGTVPHATEPGQFCGASYFEFITVPASADFEFSEACSAQEMQFNELCNYLYEYTIDDYSWDFGDPGSGANNFSTDQNPTHIFSSAGSYDVTLIIETNTGCKARKTYEVIVRDSPNVDIFLPSSTCEKIGLKFNANAEDLYGLTWDFGDPSSGAANASSNPNPIHAFETPGLYLISLSGTNIYGCEASTITSLEITEQMLTGDITLDHASPICDGDSIKLSAPAGIAYLWNNGLSTQDIFVKKPGLYEVTVTTANACNYTPDPVAIEFTKPIEPSIVGQIFPAGSWQADEYFGSLEVCQGEAFSLRTNYYSNVVYNWSIGPDSWNVPYSYFSSLSPGEHIVSLSVVHNSSGCEIAATDFKIIINPRPDEVMLVSDQTDMCEGKPFTFSVANPSPGVRYHWSNGVIGESIMVSSPGYYYCVAINEFGCSRYSTSMPIHALPNTDGFLVGCEEVCFPDTLCVQGDFSTNAYQWLLDGDPITGANNATLEINQIGDYQVILENWQGCTDTTGILSISPKTNEQSMTGKVFLDENQDGMFNGMDEAIANIPVHIMSGGTSIESSMTDPNGNYSFDPMSVASGMVEIDISGLSFTTSSPIAYSFGFTTCIEDQENNFPLIDGCSSNIEEFLTLEICPSETVVYEGNIYSANDIDTLMYTTALGCDSMLVITVNEFITPDVDLILNHACIGETNGSLTIENLSIPGTSFAIDGGAFSSDLSYSNLSIGNHTLALLSPDGCSETINFEIESIAEPTVDYQTVNSCVDMDEGELWIGSGTTPGLQFAVDDNTSYSSVTAFINLSLGSHTLYVLDDNACEYSYPFTINSFSSASVDLNAENSCQDQSTGSLTISNLSSPNLSFSINSTTGFQSDLVYTNLPAGNHTLWVLDDNNCLISYPFNIDTFTSPSVDLSTEATCLDIDSGTLMLDNPSNPMLVFAIDTPTGYTDDLLFENLSAGQHTLYVLDPNGCTSSFDFEIDVFDEPGINLATSSSCENTATGSVSISTNETGLSYSIDGVTYTGDQLFDELPVGQHILYVNNGVCDFGFLFNIEATSLPELEIITQASCDGVELGGIEINTSTEDLSYSLDNITFSDAISYEGLSIGSQTLYVLTDEGCLFEYSFIIEEVVNETPTISTNSSCESLDNGAILLSTNIAGLQYSLDGIDFQETTSFENLAPGSYTVFVLFDNGCIEALTIDIEEAAALDVEFADPATDCTTLSVDLNPTILSSNGEVEYLWNDGSNEPSFTASESGTYSVQVIDDCETREYDYVLDLSEAEHNTNVYVPNVFSRDSDAQNSIFKPLTPRDMEVLTWEFRVYDRWGNLMFVTDDPNLGWDGMYKSEIVNPGVFVWMYDITTEFCEEATHLRKYGDVTLLK